MWNATFKPNKSSIDSFSFSLSLGRKLRIIVRKRTCLYCIFHVYMSKSICYTKRVVFTQKSRMKTKIQKQQWNYSVSKSWTFHPAHQKEYNLQQEMRVYQSKNNKSRDHIVLTKKNKKRWSFCQESRPQGRLKERLLYTLDQ